MILFDEIEKLAADTPATVHRAAASALTYIDEHIVGGHKEALAGAVHAIVQAAADVTRPAPTAPAVPEAVNLAAPPPAPAGEAAPATGG